MFIENAGSEWTGRGGEEEMGEAPLKTGYED